MDFLSGQILIYANREYEDIYEYFKSDYSIETGELFIFCASVGYFFNRKSSYVKDRKKDKEFRSNYLKSLGKTSAYTMLLSDDTFRLSVEDLDESNKSEYGKYVNSLEEYAEGGMQVLIEEVFKSKFSSGVLDKNYKWYMVDLMNFISSNIQ